jgi:hypothetical protein
MSSAINTQTEAKSRALCPPQYKQTEDNTTVSTCMLQDTQHTHHFLSHTANLHTSGREAIVLDSSNFRHFARIPKNEIAQQVRDQSIAKWQIQRDNTTKGSATKQFFPIIKDRLTTKIKLTQTSQQYLQLMAKPRHTCTVSK